MKKISERIAQPTPDQVREARERAGLTQTQAAELVSSAEKAAYKTWSGYEKQEGGNKRNISLATWELFLLLTDQHPSFKLTIRASPADGGRLPKSK